MRKIKLITGVLLLSLAIFSCGGSVEKTSESSDEAMMKVESANSSENEDGGDGGGAADTGGSRSDPSGKPDNTGTHDVHDASK